ncbi:glycoside hydrolase family 2 protein [Saliterribacillus persicus]|uniref:Glycosyl hydrolase family 2 n=1 Tax=Saliterribacillus persicus TaxID=930114 RepID=A0A368XDZ0_9BACI|nr:sugar-binding domain-containing protein [Saliterribacillus persicus]RCW65869.1 glycosyl hydrolase family 2 [Saliterribacillus persicus]
MVKLKNVSRKKYSLNGEWNFTLDHEGEYAARDIGKSQSTTLIQIPGSWEEQGFGEPSKHNPIGAWKKLKEYVGTAWYHKDIFMTEEMENQVVKMVISGVRWSTGVWVNDEYVGEGESLVSDHVFDLTDFIQIGVKNKIVICVNNEMKYSLLDSHIHSYHTATNWGGITGGLYLETHPKTHIQEYKLYPKLEQEKIDLSIKIAEVGELGSNSSLLFEVFSEEDELVQKMVVPIEAKDGRLDTRIDFWDGVIYWDDLNPYLYHIRVSVMDEQNIIDQQTKTLGIRSIKAHQRHILLNDVPKFLRGYVDCCVFPQTGYPSWDKEDYLKQFKTVKEYGFNHVRLHGWTPPKPFWEAADEEGMLIQTELPHWSSHFVNRQVEPEQKAHAFLLRELYRVIDTLNEHPSFVLFSPGNELISPQGHPALNEMVRTLKTLDSTRLYTDNTGFGNLPAHDREGDFFVPTLNAHHPITLNYSGTPNTYEDYNIVTTQADKPLIAHEHGQFTMYVRPQEEEKYTGVLRPHWLETTKATLKKKGHMERVDEYIEASGTLQRRAYKENMERARRTSNLSGVQLLDIRDFPGQGHATTGVLDVFWDSKGTITPEKFRAFNDDVVLLMRCQERTMYAGEKLRCQVDLSNYSNQTFQNHELTWNLKADGKIIETGTIPVPKAERGEVTALGIIEVKTPSNQSQSLTLSVSLEAENKSYKNEWEFWSYLRPVLHKEANRIWTDISQLDISLYGAKYTGKIGFEGFSYKEEKDIDLAISDHLSTELLQFVLDGGKGWIIAEEGNQYDEVKTRFLPIFWNYIWFPTQIGTTMGMIIHDHPSLSNFSHDGRSNWNWFHLVDQAVAINLENVPQVKPIVEVVDNHNRGKHLAYSFEMKIGAGKLYMTSFQLLNSLKRPEAEVFLHESIHYLMSDDFNPEADVTVGELLGIFKLQGN